MSALASFGLGAPGVRLLADSSNQALTSPLLAATLTLSPASAVPNQSIAILGTGFTTATTAGGAGAAGVHQITGTGASVVTIGGITLTAPHITYPINLDSAGSLVAPAVVPINATTLATGSISVQVTDDQGVTASATLTVPARTITLSPTSSRRLTTVTVTGVGFPGDNLSVAGSITVSITYTATAVASVSPDSGGNFTTTFPVPATAAIPSTNTVTASIVGQTGTATATHSLPSASITVSPASSPSGFTVTVIGINFPAFVGVSSLKVGPIQALPSSGPNTNGDGTFTANMIVPSLPVGPQIVIATVGGLTAVANLTVLASLVPPTPTPTPTPTIVDPDIALEPLSAVDNLERVWHFNNTTKSWTFYDPRPGFSSVNTLSGMVTGQGYWIKVFQDQTVILNSRNRVMIEGWNLVAW